jgi:hypothetical protein
MEKRYPLLRTFLALPMEKAMSGTAALARNCLQENASSFDVGVLILSRSEWTKAQSGCGEA